jgi:hypothetical protein
MPEFNPRIDLGHILTIAILLVSLGVGWGNLSAVKDRLEEVYADMKTLTVTVNAMEVNQGENSERIKSVEKQLEYLQENGSDKGQRK